MDIGLYLLAALPFAVALAAKFLLRSTINWQEWGVIAVCGVLIAVGVYHSGRLSQTSATEIWNGEITRKYERKEDCPWGWRTWRDNFCDHYRTRQVYVGQTCTGTGSSRVCTPNYDTEYNYIYDWERKFYVDLSLRGETVRIANIDQQGAQVPPRWSSVKVGDPASITNSYTNWIRGAHESLFAESAAVARDFRAENLLPDYPNEIVDYYRVDRILTVGVDLENEREWNRKLGLKLTELGPRLEMNALFVLVDADFGERYADALRYHWKGFQKNDVVTVVGVSGDTSVEWARVMSWSKSPEFNKQLARKIEGENTLSADAFMGHLYAEALANYERRAMVEFEHLKSELPTPTWVWILAAFLGLLVPGGLIWLFHNVDFNPLGKVFGSK
jgi:hypothetical protein